MRRLLLIALALLIVGVPAYAWLTGLSAVIIENKSAHELNVVLFTGAQPIGSGRIASGGEDFFTFTPHSDGVIVITCRKDDQSASRSVRAAHVTANSAAIYRLALRSCTQVSEDRR